MNFSITRITPLIVTLTLATLAQAVEKDPGFTPLFDGQTLDGWVGDKENYVAEDGILICQEGRPGNLMTENQYEDFILRFEFKLTPGANSGLAIRSPRQGGSFEGIELQIIDNTADKYKDLKEWQYHGSAYGIAPAERGHLAPVGQWNKQEVTVKDSQVRVVLNGATILDVNLDEAAEGGTIDGRDHPALDRETGHIGFLGHNDHVEFRDIRIKDLSTEE